MRLGATRHDGWRHSDLSRPRQPWSSDLTPMPGRTIANHPNSHGRTTTMRKTLSIVLTLAMLIGAAPLLAACHTTAGAGQDISATGNALTNSAEKHTP
jgi:predicted small secreted protein